MEQKSELHLFDTLGALSIGVDKRTHEIVVILRTPVGAVHAALTADRATQLGCSLIRAGGERWDFSAELARKEDSNATPDQVGLRRPGAFPGGSPLARGNGGPGRLPDGEGRPEGGADEREGGPGQPAD